MYVITFSTVKVGHTQLSFSKNYV